MCQAARSYYHSVYQEKKFQLYNTPVLDFIESGQRKKADFLIVIFCRDEEYGRGLFQAVNRIPVHIQVFSSAEEMKKRMGNQKPSLWITDEFFWEKVQNSGLQNLAIPTILLAKKKKDESSPGSEDTRLTVLSMPVHPDELHRAVNDCLTFERMCDGAASSAFAPAEKKKLLTYARNRGILQIVNDICHK